MKKTIVSLAVAGLMVAGNAMATDMPPLAKELNCTACHAVDKKVVGPAWMDVSKFYNGKMEKSAGGKDVKTATGGKTAEEWLVHKVSKGGSGNWGSMAMPANDPTGAKKEKIQELVKFVLGLAK